MTYLMLRSIANAMRLEARNEGAAFQMISK
jgi:hypothetical protein